MSVLVQVAMKAWGWLTCKVSNDFLCAATTAATKQKTEYETMFDLLACTANNNCQHASKCYLKFEPFAYHNMIQFYLAMRHWEEFC